MFKEGLKNPTENLLAQGRSVNRKLKEEANKIRSKWRKIVTGDEKKRIRDHIRETEEQPKYIKLFDKIQFTLGVLNICACQFFLLNRPEFFWLWYSIVVPIMMLTRFYHFRSLGFQYFMIDFCYFVICLTLVNIFLVQNSALFFKVCFIYANGPLTIAIPIWRNSFIFHDFDKIVSVYVHLLPSMLYYTLRWHTIWQNGPAGGGLESVLAAGERASVCYNATCEPLTFFDYGVATLGYFVWQVLYIMKTEVLDKKRLDSHPELITSLRWMSSDTKNALARSILKSLRRVRLFGKQEEFDSASLKTKGVFICSQLLVTWAGFLPTPLLYYSPVCHLVFIVLIFTSSIFNGASFYIEVFSKRYNQKIAKIEEMHRITRDAEVLMNEIAAIKKSNSSKSVLDECAAETAPAARADHGHGDGNRKEASQAEPKSGLSKTTPHPSADSLDAISEGMQQTSDEAWAALQKHAVDLHYLMTGGEGPDSGKSGGGFAAEYSQVNGRSLSNESAPPEWDRDSFEAAAAAAAMDEVEPVREERPAESAAGAEPAIPIDE